MKLATKLAVILLAAGILTACKPAGPSQEQLAVEQQAKVVYETAKTDFDKYKSWRVSANKTIQAMNAMVAKLPAEKDPKNVLEMYQNSAKELLTLANDLKNIQFGDARFEPLKTKGTENFTILADLMLEATKYLTTETPADVKQDMAKRRDQAIKAINQELGELEDNIVKALNADAQKYNEIRQQNHQTKQ